MIIMITEILVIVIVIILMTMCLLVIVRMLRGHISALTPHSSQSHTFACAILRILSCVARHSRFHTCATGQLVTRKALQAC